MQPHNINEQTFSTLSAEALDFYRQHGFVVINDQFEAEIIHHLDTECNRLIAKDADEMEMSADDYAQVINQWRDLWKTEAVFKRLLHDERIHGTAQFFMEEPSVQLLHDHVISKPCEAQNKRCHTNEQLPWHQDYPFWPVNTPNSLSLWVPFEDVGADGGCLEVVEGSHSWGPSAPVDFIMDDPERFKDRDDISLVRIPVAKGSMVVLHSLTWHRSHPNYTAGSKRLAYIPLWIPSHAQYSPDTRKWHPLNDNITVAIGETLNTNHFPRFGKYEEDPATRQRRVGKVNEPKFQQNPMSMFEADTHIAGQIHQLLQSIGEQSERHHLRDYVGDAELRDKIVKAAISQGLIEKQQNNELETLLETIHVSTEAYNKHRARNVFNSGYAGWWHLVGKKLSSLQTTDCE